MRFANIFSTILAVILVTGSAAAHHPLNGMPMETFVHGLLSGIGHPLLGFDHLFFVISAGIVAVFTAARVVSLAAYLVAMVAGCLLMYIGTALPLTELIIAASLIVVGGLLVISFGMQNSIVIGLFLLFGLFHGSAFGGSIATAESTASITVLSGYLLGLIAIQFLIGWLAGGLTKTLSKASSNIPTMGARLTGAAVAGVGGFLILEILEGPLVQALI